MNFLHLWIFRLLHRNASAKSSAQGVILVFSMCCLPHTSVFCSPQLNLPFGSGYTFLPPFQMAPQRSSVTVGPPPAIAKGGAHDVEMFRDDVFYVCNSSLQPGDYLLPMVSAIFRLEHFDPYRSNCIERYHPFYLLRYPGRISKSLISQTAKYSVLFGETTKVVLYKNNIIAIPPNYFCDLRNVTSLEIGGNTIASSENLGFSQQCASNDCCLALKKLQLVSNDLKVLVGGSFCGFPNLEELDVSKNSIDEVDEGAFAKLDNLLKLSLSKNLLKTLPRGVFLSLKRLLALDLSSNHLTGDVFTRLESLSALEVLRLSSNGIAVIQSHQINGLESLSELYLDDNRIASLENPFGKLDNIVLLVLSVNSISHISNTTFAPLVNLTVLKLAYNAIGQLSGAHFELNEKLAHLDITGNKFTSLPDLTVVKTLKKLVVNENDLIAITGEDGRIICNMQNLEELHMELNKIKNISAGALDCNLTLKVLNLNSNNLRSVRGAFANARIEKLLIARNEIEELLLDDVADDVVEANFRGNRIVTLRSPFEQRLRNMSLTRLNLEDNLMTDLSGVHLPPSLEYLLLGSNKLEFLDVGNFEMATNSAYFALENLQMLSVSSNAIQSVCPLIFYLIASETYPDLDLQENPLNCGCEITFLLKYEEKIRPGQGQPHLPSFGTCSSWQQSPANKRLSAAIHQDGFSCQAKHSNPFCECNLNSFYSTICKFPCPERCLCYLSSDYKFQFINCTDAAFDSLPELVSQLPLHLQFTSNSLTNVDDTTLRSYFRAVTLHLDKNRINRIESGAFKGVSHLQVLNLEANLLQSLPDGAFDHLFELTKLYLAHNRLMHLSVQVFHPLPAVREIRLHDNDLRDFPIWDLNVSSTLARLSLRDNPWSCDCHYIEQFRLWLQNSSHVVEDVNKLFCTADNGTVQNSPLLSFNSSQCYVLKDRVLITNVALWTSVLASIFLVSLLCVLVFVYRREMQVLIYSNYGLRLFYRYPEELDADKLYDAFVAHSALDEEFLANELIPRLEQIEQPYHLCIHQRDFLVGAVITESILEAVEKSRRTMVLLSENFVRSEWCRFEFKSAHLKTLADRCNRLIVIVLGRLPADLEPEMKLYLKTNTYLEWGDRLFWEKLYFALPDRRPSD